MIKMHTSLLYGAVTTAMLLAAAPLVADVKIANRTEMAFDRTPDATLEVKAPDSLATTSALLVNDGSNFPLLEVQANGFTGIRTSTPAGPLHVRATGKGVIVNGSGTAYTGEIWAATASEDGVQIGNNFVAIQRSASVPLLLSHPTGALEDTYMSMLYNGAEIGTIDRVGTTGVSYLTTSDARLKENIRAARVGIDEVMGLDVVDYEFKSEPGKQHTGFLAQNLYEVYPDAVSVGGEDPEKNPWRVDYGRVTPLLVKAIQEQQALIADKDQTISEIRDHYDNQLQSLRSKYAEDVSALRSELESLKSQSVE